MSTIILSILHTPCVRYVPRRIFGAPLTTGNGDATYSPATATLAPKTKTDTSDRVALAAELHSAVEQGDAEAVAGVLSNLQQRDGDAEIEKTPQRGLSPLVDCACSRTGLTPLLKAVERRSEEVVRVLLEAGGDVHSQVRGYNLDLRFFCTYVDYASAKLNRIYTDVQMSASTQKRTWRCSYLTLPAAP